VTYAVGRPFWNRGPTRRSVWAWRAARSALVHLDSPLLAPPSNVPKDDHKGSFRSPTMPLIGADHVTPKRRQDELCVLRGQANGRAPINFVRHRSSTAGSRCASFAGRDRGGYVGVADKRLRPGSTPLEHRARPGTPGLRCSVNGNATCALSPNCALNPGGRPRDLVQV
jgi:hypothetical protein